MHTGSDGEEERKKERKHVDSGLEMVSNRKTVLKTVVRMNLPDRSPSFSQHKGCVLLFLRLLSY